MALERIQKENSGDLNVDGIVSRMHSYRTDLGVYVDREKEAWEVLGFGRGVIRDGTISILYGPRGCGKTTLFAALISSLANFRDRSVEIHYVSIDDAGGILLLHQPIEV